MTVVGIPRLDKFMRKHAASKPALQSWLAEARAAVWSRPQEIKDRYRSADFLSNSRVIFNIKGNRFRLVVKVRYEGGLVLIEWVGTHAEYDKQNF